MYGTFSWNVHVWFVFIESMVFFHGMYGKFSRNEWSVFMELRRGVFEVDFYFSRTGCSVDCKFSWNRDCIFM